MYIFVRVCVCVFAHKIYRWKRKGLQGEAYLSEEGEKGGRWKWKWKEGWKRADLTRRLLRVHHPRTQSQELHVFCPQLGGELRNDHVKRRLHRRVGEEHRVSISDDGIVEITQPRAKDDNLLNRALQHQRQERVDRVYDAEDVGVKAGVHIFVQGLRVGGRGEGGRYAHGHFLVGVRAIHDQDVEAGGEEGRRALGGRGEGGVGGHVAGEHVDVFYAVAGEAGFHRGWCSRQSDDRVGWVAGEVLDPCVLEKRYGLVL